MGKRLTLWMVLKRDFKERFLKFETVRGLMLMPFGVILAVTTWTHFQYSIQVFMTATGLYWFVDGAYKIFVNRVKEQVKLQKQVEYAVAADAIK